MITHKIEPQPATIDPDGITELIEKSNETQNIGNTTLNEATNTFPAGLGGGKERSVIYLSKLCKTAAEIDDYLNKDAYAYNYIYWNPQAKGVMVTICKPNPKSYAERYAKRVERGMQELTEDDATGQIKRLFTLDKNNDQFQEEMQVLISRLYENGFKNCSTSRQGTAMTDPQDPILKQLEDLKKIVIETQEKVDIIRDEITEAIEETTKTLTEKIQLIDVYQRKTLEPNQQTLNSGLEKIYETVKGIKETQEIEENDKSGDVETE